MSNLNSSTCLSDLETICGALENIIKKCLGPFGQSTLLSSNTGHVTLSSDGLTILSSLHLSHPIAKAIVKSLDSFISHNGDGCKTMVLYLTSLFRAMRKEADKHVLSSTVDNEIFLKVFLSQSLFSFLSLDLLTVIDEMSQRVADKMKLELRLLKVEYIIFMVIKSVLNGALPNADFTAQLAKVITEYLTNDCVTIGDIRKQCHWFDSSVFLSPHQMYSLSHVSNGIFLASRMFSKNELLPLCDVTFICIQCPIDGSKEDDGSILQLNSPEVVVRHRDLIMEQFLVNVNKLKISLIITSSKMQDHCLQRCQDFNLTVIDCVDDADLQWICDVCQKCQLTSVKECIVPTNLMNASYCGKVTFAQKSYAKIVLNQNRDSHHPKGLFLCAPSEGICQQLKIKIKRCMIVILELLNSISTENDPLNSTSVTEKMCSNIIAGNGYFELLLCQHLRSYCDKHINYETKMCCSLLQNMLVTVLKALNRKECRKLTQGTTSQTILDLLCEINFVDSENSCLELNQADDFNSLVNIGSLEVMSIKIASVYSTVSLALKLLKMDKIIGVRTMYGAATEDESEYT